MTLARDVQQGKPPMIASFNAAVSSSRLASTRDPRDVNADSSSGNRESFSQVFRRTSQQDEKPSGANRSREADKRDGKSGKKDDDTNTTASATASGNAPVVEKSVLPITFLFGLPTQQQPETSGPQDGSDAPASSQVGAKAGNSNGALQAALGVFANRMVDENGDPVLPMTGTSTFTPPDNVDGQKADASSAKLDSSELSVGSSDNSSKGAAAGALSANTLAFAMRLGSGETLTASKVSNSAQPASSPASQSTQVNTDSSAMASIVQAASGSQLEENAHQHDPSAQEQNIVDLSPASAPPHFDGTKLAEDNPTAPAAQVPADPPASATAEPVRNVHMQLVSDDNRRVDVRLVDRGGELHVSVKSADPALTQNLQDHLPDLTARLDKQHMQSEVWVPKAAEPTKAEGGSTNGSLSDPNARSYSGNSEGRKDGRQQAKPDWVDALENYT